MAEITVKDIAAEIVENDEAALQKQQKKWCRAKRCEYEIFLLDQQQDIRAIYALCRKLHQGEERYYAQEPERLLQKGEDIWLILEKDEWENLSGLKAKLAVLSQSIKRNLHT